MDMTMFRRRGLLLNTPHIVNESGSIVTFESPYNKVLIKRLICNIGPIQAGSGDPSPENVRPISGRTGLSVTRTGKNLLPTNTVALGKPGNRTADIELGTKLKPGTYHMSYNRGGSFTGNGGIQAFNENTFIANVNINTGILQLPVEATRFYFYFPSTNYDNNETLIFDEIQLELGSTATSYEPYKGNTYSVNWESEAGTVYGGTLDVVTGKLTVDRAMWTGNTFDMNNNEDYPGWCNAGIKEIVGEDLNEGLYSAISNVSPAITSGNWAIGANTKGQYGTGALLLNKHYFNKNQTEWKALALDVQVVLPLATPITVQLTPQEVRTLLGENNIWCDSGDVSVDYWKWGK